MTSNTYNAFVILSDLHFIQLYENLSVQSLSQLQRDWFAHFRYSKCMVARQYNPDLSIQAFECTAVRLLNSPSIN